MMLPQLIVVPASDVHRAGLQLEKDCTQRLCCANRMRDASHEARVVARCPEQTDIADLQDPELASV